MSNIRHRVLTSSLLLSLAATAPAQATGTAASLSATPIPANNTWQRYVRTPATADVRPIKVLSASGDIDNPQGLVNGGETTLTWKTGQAAPVLLLDYGQEIGGLPQFEVSAFSGTPSLSAAFSETTYLMSAKGDGSNSATMGNSGSTQTWFELPVRAAGTLAPTAIQGGFRYQRLTLSQPGSVKLRSVTTRFAAPLIQAAQYDGYFLSDDEVANRAWFDSAYTLMLNLVEAGTPGTNGKPYDQPVVLDGAKRDRAVWASDLRISGPALHNAFGANGDRYFKGSLAVIAANPAGTARVFATADGSAGTPGPMAGVCHGATNDTCQFYSATYSFDFPMALREYWYQSGDLAFVRAQWPLVKREIDWENTLVDSRSGLVDLPVAASAVWSVGLSPGKTTAANILHHAALLSAAEMAEALGDSVAQDYRQRAAQTKAAINAALWNEQRGYYEASTQRSGALVQDANVWAIHYGIASAEQGARIMGILDQRLATDFGPRMSEASTASLTQRLAPKVSPYIGSFQLLANYRLDRAAPALQQLHQTWGWMQRNEPASTVWERIDLPDGTLGAVSIFTKDPSESAAHAWSTGPGIALQRHVLGIEPLAAGYARWHVRPQPAGLQWAQGRISTPAGTIDSRWQLGTANGSFQLTVVGPAGTSGRIEIPLLGQSRQVYCDGQLVWTGSAAANGARASLAGDYLGIDDIGGTHTCAWVAAAAP